MLHQILLRSSPYPLHIYSWNTQCRTLWVSDQLIATPLFRTTHHIKRQTSMPTARFELTMSVTGSQDLHLRPHGQWGWHKQYLHCLLKWLTACIHFGCNFCTQFQYNISLITIWSKSYYGFLCMYDFQAGSLNGSKMKDLILPASIELASARNGFGSASSCTLPFKIHCFILSARQPSSLPVTTSAPSCVNP